MIFSRQNSKLNILCHFAMPCHMFTFSLSKQLISKFWQLPQCSQLNCHIVRHTCYNRDRSVKFPQFSYSIVTFLWNTSYSCFWLHLFSKSVKFLFLKKTTITSYSTLNESQTNTSKIGFKLKGTTDELIYLNASSYVIFQFVCSFLPNLVSLYYFHLLF